MPEKAGGVGDQGHQGPREDMNGIQGMKGVRGGMKGIAHLRCLAVAEFIHECPAPPPRGRHAAPPK